MLALQLSILLFLFVACTSLPESFTAISEAGKEFTPIDESALLLGTYVFSNYYECVYSCQTNYFCRVFDYDTISQRCRLFEGDLSTTGSIISSNSSTSSVSQIQLYSELFSTYGQPCSTCIDSRYLTCINSTCICRGHTYWTGSVCASQYLRGGPCANSSQCRADLNHTCLQFYQCGPNSLLMGITRFGNANGSPGNSSSSLDMPWGITVNADGSILIADAYNSRVLYAQQNSTIGVTIAGSGGQIYLPCKAIFDPAMQSNLYVLNDYPGFMMLWANHSATGVNVFGSQGSTLSQLNSPASFYFDSNRSFYIADQGNHRILLWRWNASSGIVIAGVSGVNGADNFHLNIPSDLFVDETTGQMYVADFGNHRVVRYTLGSPNGTVVAGGNGPGSQRNQLNHPIGVCVSKKTGAIYVADQGNNRVQRWFEDDSQGVTIAGSPQGYTGSSSLLLNNPNPMALDVEETHLFVSDRDNHRIQMFELV